ncbi:hypothetical protein MCERE10_03641 [Burkholderiaceae bacterium]
MAKKANVAKYVDIVKCGAVLHGEYKQYVDTYVHRANKELYAMLGKILQFSLDVINREDKEVVITTIRKVLKDEFGLNITTKTGDLGVLLRLVLRSAHKKTIFVYKRVLQQAIDNGIGADKLAEYIEANGGIERLRVGQAQTEVGEKLKKQDKHMSGFAAELLNETAKQPLAVFTVDDALTARMHDAANKCNFRYMVCTYNGTYKVVDIVPMDKELEQSILARIANYKAAELEYFMSATEMERYERVKHEYAVANNLKAKPSIYAKVKAANDDTVNGEPKTGS